MIGERENKYTDTEYGTLHMRNFVIDGNEINAFYDSSDDLVFVLDNTINANKPNVLLVMNPDGDRKWDEILSNDYDVDLETIRPKQDNKYQKLDIEYSGLNVYEELINAYNSGDDLTEELNQLNVLRNSAVRHSAMVRLNAANEIISKTNTTIVKTKETIVRLQERIKTLRAKLTSTKKEIGRVSTKQSAAQILKLESQIEALTEKLKRAKKRLESAQKRLETATIDAELASELLNQPALEIKTVTKRAVKNKPVMVAPKHAVQKVEPEPEDEEDDTDFDDEVATDESNTDINDDVNDDNDVKPLFDSDPQILNEDIAFKPISFTAPVVSEEKQQIPEPVIPNVPELSEPESEEPQMESYSAPELPQPETHEEIPYLNDVFVAPEMPTTTEPMAQQNTEEQTSEKPMLESLAPISNVPEITPDYSDLTEDMIEEKPTNENSVLESITPIERQSEPVVAEEHETVIESEPVKNVAAQNDNLVAPMTESMHDSMVGEDKNKHKPTLMYYLLLVVLIMLSVFTLWLYQNNTTNTAPTLSATVEKAAVLKKTEKPAKAKKVAEPVVKGTEEVADEDVFFDEEPTNDTDTVTVDVSEPAEAPEPEEDEVDIVSEPSEPVVIDAVPARVTSSGVSEESEKEIASEEEILAKKPVYEPGNKHDAMFVGTDADEQEYEDEVEYDDTVVVDSDDEVIYYDEEDPFYDAEEAAYQAEQAELEYDE